MLAFGSRLSGFVRLSSSHRLFSQSTLSMSDMLCMQCQQTEHNTGCTTVGVCSKTPETANLQDLLINQLQRLSYYAVRSKLSDAETQNIGSFISNSLFSTMTNVNFDPERMKEEIVQTLLRTEKLAAGAASHPPSGIVKGVSVDLGSAEKASKMSPEELSKLGTHVGVDTRKATAVSPDVWSVREMILYGLKGTCAYADHAHEMSFNDTGVWRDVPRYLDSISTFGANTTDLGALLGTALEVGATNVRVMQLLDTAHNETFGPMQPTTVSHSPKAGPCVVVSGHDLPDFYALCKAAEGRGVNVFSHGELLPAGARPKINSSPAYAGHFGGPWQLQRAEFPTFPGPIVLTTNCLMEPRKSYIDRLYTRSAVGWKGVKHIKSRDDFKQVIDHALRLPHMPAPTGPAKTILTGFGHQAIMSVADKVIDAVKSGAIKNFLLVGGCDGAAGERSYFRDVVMQSPKDSVILTLACGKYRFLDKQYELGDIGGIPRLLDMGQCNDAYGAVVVASALQQAFGLKSINELPLSFYVSWYEQKAVAVLLSLLHLGVQNIRLGPTLPAFVTPNVLNVLVEKFNIAPTTTAGADRKSVV